MPPSDDGLIDAIYRGDIARVETVLGAGADPSAPADDGFPPLLAAVSCLVGIDGDGVSTRARELVAILLRHGADVEQRGINDWTALHLAASYGDVPTVQLLLAHGADADAVTHIDDPETPIEVASHAGHADVVELLRVPTRRLDWEDAGRAGDTRTLRRMLRAGYDVNTRDGYGQTALMRAARVGQREVVETLVDAGAALDHTAKFGLSALMLAVLNGHHRIARLLVRAGADRSLTGTGAPGFHGRTAADLADERGDARLAEYIRTWHG